MPLHPCLHAIKPRQGRPNRLFQLGVVLYAIGVALPYGMGTGHEQIDEGLELAQERPGVGVLNEGDEEGAEERAGKANDVAPLLSRAKRTTDLRKPTGQLIQIMTRGRLGSSVVLAIMVTIVPRTCAHGGRRVTGRCTMEGLGPPIGRCVDRTRRVPIT